MESEQVEAPEDVAVRERAGLEERLRGLEARRDRLDADRRAVNDAINEAKVALCPIVVGSLYRDQKGRLGRLTEVQIYYGRAVGIVRLLKKNGEVGARFDHVDSWRGWKLVSEPAEVVDV
jgi:hypothetical protein